MKTRRSIMLAGLCLALSLICSADSIRPGLYRNVVYVPAGPVPTSPTAAFTASTDVYMVVLTNTNASTQATVTISCTTGSVVFVDALINGVSTQNNHLAIPYPDGYSCPGGVTWSSSVSGVNGFMTGKQ